MSAYVSTQSARLLGINGNPKPSISLATFNENVKRGLNRKIKAPIPRQNERRVPHNKPSIPLDMKIIKVKVRTTFDTPRMDVKRTKIRDLAEALNILRSS
jgi:hypothetical protein